MKRPSLSSDEDSRGERIAAFLKLGSALCLLVAASLFALPPLRVKLATASPMDLGASATAGQDGAEAPAETGPESSQAAIQETRTQFKGAILMLESVPLGASARVNGVDQGETPVSVGLDCMPGKTVVVEFTLRNFEKTVYNTPCPKDAVITVKARMRRDTGKSSGKR